MASNDRMRDNKGRFTTKKNDNNSNWFKNAAKSLGYAGIDLIKETMPAVTETIDINKEWATNVTRTLRQTSNNKRLGSLEQQLSGQSLKVYKGIKDIKSNALADLKSGNFYNKERLESYADNFGLDDDFSFDFSDDYSDENFEASAEDSGDDNVVVPTVNITSNINKNNPMVQAVAQHSRLTAELESARSKRDITIAETQMNLDRKIGETLYGGIGTVNENLSILVNFNNEHVGGYIGASFKYYEDSVRLLGEISEGVKKLNTIAEKTYETPTDPLDNVISSSGGFNISEYTKLVKKQFGNVLDENMLTGSLKSMLLEGDGLEAIAQAPLKALPGMLLSKIVPSFLVGTLGSFDKSFKAFIPALLNKVASWADDIDATGDGLLGSVKGFLGRVLGVKNAGRTSIDPSKYEKGPLPFDGVTKKSIVEVIPGYLAKILSALTGREEMIFDSDKGTFVSRSELKSNYDKTLRSAALSQYDSIEEIKNRTRAFGLRAEDQNAVDKLVDELFFKISSSQKHFNPNIVNGKDDISDLIGHSNGAEVIRAAILSLSNAEQMQLVGANHYNARRSLAKTLEEMERTGNTAALAQFNNLFSDEFNYGSENNPLSKTFYSQGEKVTSSIFTPSDGYGKNSLDYLRDIRSILLEGIGVWILDTAGRAGVGPRGINYTKGELDPLVSKKGYNNTTYTPLTPEQIEQREREGIRNFEDLFNLPREQEELQEIIDGYVKAQTDTKTAKQKGKNPLAKVVKFLFGGASDRAEIVNNTIDDLFAKGGNIFKNFFDKLDNSMYNLVFGTKDDEPHQNFFERVTISINGTMDKFFNYLREKVYEPIREGLVGKDGIVTKFKESEFYKNLKEKATKAFDYLLGGKEVDENGNFTGKRSGGLLSGVANSFKEIGDSTKLYITGTLKDKDGKVIATQEGSVFSEMKQIFTGFKNSFKEYLFGSNPNETKENAKGLFAGLGESLKEGFQTFTDLFFGKKRDTEGNLKSNVQVDELTQKLKDRAPKTIASGIIGGSLGMLAGAGGFGILGSLFLGPMSGVVLGLGTGLLSQSESFKKWLFGDKDYDENGNETGNRLGGFLSKSTQDFFKKNKSTMIGGAAIGTLKGLTGFGILPSFILGGPITGALFGLGTALAVRSDAFQKMIFGEEGEDGRRRGGVLNKLTGSFNDKETKKKLGLVGAGAGLGAITGGMLSSFGILGSIAFGPLSGALLGAGAGIALAADKWKNAIFGEYDEDGNKTKEGIMGKMMAAVTVNVLQPAKVQMKEWSYNVQDWFASNIAEPFMNSLDPIKEEISRLKNRITEFAYGVLEKLHVPQMFKGLGDKISEGFSSITKKFGEMISKGTEAIASFTGKILSSPFKALNFIADKILMPKHMKEGIKSIRNQIIENIKESDFVQKVVNPVVDTVKTGVTHVTDFTKNTIKGFFGFAGKLLMGTLKFVGKSAASAVAAPFKGIAGIFKGIGAITGLFKNMSGGARDTDRLSEISRGSGGNRGFLQSVGDLAATFNPFSSLRRAAKYSSPDITEIRERVIRSALANGETIDDAEINKRVESELRRNPGGASYADDRAEAAKRRREENAAKKAEHDRIIADLKAKVKANKDKASSAGYNLLTKEEREALSFDELNKIIDKDYASKYGKSWKAQSDIDKARIRSEMTANEAAVETKDSAKEIVNILKNGVAVSNLSSVLGGEGDGTSSSVTNDESKTTDLQFNTHGTTAFEARAEEEAKSEKKKRKGFFARVEGLLENIGSGQKKHSDLWSSIFSKKGLIGAGIILALPHIIKFFQDPISTLGGLVTGLISNIGPVIKSAIFGSNEDESSPERTDSTGEHQKNTDAEEPLVRAVGAITSTALKAGSKVSEEISNPTSRTGKLLSKLFNNNTGVYTADEIAKQMGTSTDEVYELLGKSKKYTADDIAKGFGTTAANVSDNFTPQKSLFSRFMTFAKEKVTTFIDLITKKFPGLKLDKVKKIIQESLEHLGKTKIGSASKRLMARVSEGMAKISSYGAAGIGLAIDTGFATYGLVTGATKAETANLFGVSTEDADGVMRTISASLKAILNVSWFFVIDILNEFATKPLFGFDLIKFIAETVYSALTGADGLADLKQDQQAFEADYQSYTLTQQIAKGNMYTDETGILRYKDESLIETKDSYNDRTNESAFSKITGGIGSWLDSTKRFLFGNEEDTEKTVELLKQKERLEKAVEAGLISTSDIGYIQTMQSIDSALEKNVGQKNIFGKIADFDFGEFTKGLFKPMMEKISDIGGFMSDLFAPVKEKFTEFTDGAKELGKYAGKVISNMKDIARDVENPTDITISETDPMSGPKSVINKSLKVLLFPFYMVNRAIHGLKPVIDPIVSAVVNTGTSLVQGTASMFTDIMNGDTIFSQNYWTAPAGDNNLFKFIGFYAQRILTSPIGLAMSVGKLALDKVVKPAADIMMNVGSAIVEDNVDMFKDIMSGDSIFSTNYWTAPEDSNLFRFIGFYAQRILTSPIGLAMSVGKFAYDKVIKPVADSVFGIGKALVEDNVDMFKDIMAGDTVFNQNYWTAPEDSNLFRFIGFYAQRILTTPISLPMSIGKLAIDKITDFVKGFKGTGSILKDAMNIDKISSDGNFFSYNGSSSDLNIINQLTFKLARIVMMPVYAVKTLAKGLKDGVVEKVKGAWDWFKDLFNIDDLFEDPVKRTTTSTYTTTANGATYSPGSAYLYEGAAGGGIDLLNEYRVSTAYGKTGNLWSDGIHKGIDLVKDVNTPVASFTDGTVIKAINAYAPNTGSTKNSHKNDGGGYGNHVYVQDKNGYIHRYAHLNATNVVEGQHVSEGTILGKLGHTGNSTGAHLHYEVRLPNGGTHTNPSSYLRDYVSGSVVSAASNMLSGTSSTGITNASNNTGLAGIASALSTELTSMFTPLTDVTTQLTNEFNSLLGMSSTATAPNASTASAPSNYVTTGQSAYNPSNYVNRAGLAAGIIQGAEWIARNYTHGKYGQNTLYKMRFNNGKHQYATDPEWANKIASIMSGAPPYTSASTLLHQNLTQFSPISENEINSWVRKKKSSSPFIGNADIFLDASRSSGLDPRYILAHAALESGWGTSKIARDKNNYFGIGAFDASPYASAYSFGGGIDENDIGTRKELFPRIKNRIQTTIKDILPHGGGSLEIDEKVYGFLTKIVDVLTAIKDNTLNTSNKIEDLKTIESEKSTNNVTVVDNSKKSSSSTMYDIASKRRTEKLNKGYQAAKAIAAGGQ